VAERRAIRTGNNSETNVMPSVPAALFPAGPGPTGVRIFGAAVWGFGVAGVTGTDGTGAAVSCDLGGGVGVAGVTMTGVRVTTVDRGWKVMGA
jgi:hypothetical protein